MEQVRNTVQSYPSANAAAAFADWGIPTLEVCVMYVQPCLSPVLLRSGGMKNGVDAAKAIAWSRFGWLSPDASKRRGKAD